MTTANPVSTDNRVGEARSFPPALRAFHWGMAALIFLAIAIAIVAVELPRGPLRVDLLGVHKSIGVTVLALIAFRVILRISTTAPDYAPPLDPSTRAAAHAVHFALYALMVALPLSGYLHSAAGRHDFAWFGLFPVPDLVSPSAALDRSAGAVHYLLAWAIGAALTMHLGAVVWHALVERDGVLARMWPGALAAARRD